jgi:hypothetical protein
MAVGHLTYLSLNPAQRQLAAMQVRDQVRKALANPYLSASQRAILHAQIDRIGKWERGTLAVGAPWVTPEIPSEP